MTETPAISAPEGIVVLGCPRSGTTLLRRLLNAHSAIACPGETNVLAACARFLAEDRGADGLKVGAVQGLAFAGFSESETLARLREFAFGFFREQARKAGKVRWAEKSAFDAFHVDAIDRLCAGHVRYVCMIRHGVDVACSLEDFCARTQGYLSELHEYVNCHARPLEAFAHAWVDVSGRLLDLVRDRPEEALLVRYEDLVARPEEQLQRVLAFVEAPFEAAILERAFAEPPAAGFGDWKIHATRGVDAAPVDRSAGLPASVRSDLGRIVQATLERGGYDPVPTEPPRSDDENRRRYELGLLLQSMKPPKADPED
jgi:hypothetical protein